ncbi:MAG: hypothetical protein ACE5QF_05835 [Thermoplasmata archaeon]
MIKPCLVRFKWARIASRAIVIMMISAGFVIPCGTVNAVRSSYEPLSLPTIVLDDPPNGGSFSQASWRIILNSTVADADGDAMTVRFFAGNSSSIPDAHGLVYEETSVSSGATMRYNLTALPIASDSGPLVLPQLRSRMPQPSGCG